MLKCIDVVSYKQVRPHLIYLKRCFFLAPIHASDDGFKVKLNLKQILSVRNHVTFGRKDNSDEYEFIIKV